MAVGAMFGGNTKTNRATKAPTRKMVKGGKEVILQKAHVAKLLGDIGNHPPELNPHPDP